MLLITPPPPILPIPATTIFRKNFSQKGVAFFKKNFMIDSGRVRRADQFDIYQHGVPEACKLSKIGVEKLRPRGGSQNFFPGGGRIFQKNFMIESGRVRRADQFDIYQHGVPEACKWSKIGVEKLRPGGGVAKLFSRGGVAFFKKFL